MFHNSKSEWFRVVPYDQKKSKDFPKDFLHKKFWKESIQPQVPLRLPCYDFTSVTHHLVTPNPSFHKKIFKILTTLKKNNPKKGQLFKKVIFFFFENVEFQSFGDNQFPWCDGRCVQGSGTYSPRHADPRLLVIPSSWCRVADTNPNWDDFSGFAQICILAPHCDRHCSTCVAQSIRAVRTWRHPHLPPVYHWQFDESIKKK